MGPALHTGEMSVSNLLTCLWHMSVIMIIVNYAFPCLFLLHNSSFEYTNNFYKKNNTKKQNCNFFNRLVGFR